VQRNKNVLGTTYRQSELVEDLLTEVVFLKKTH